MKGLESMAHSQSTEHCRGTHNERFYRTIILVIHVHCTCICSSRLPSSQDITTTRYVSEERCMPISFSGVHDIR